MKFSGFKARTKGSVMLSVLKIIYRKGKKKIILKVNFYFYLSIKKIYFVIYNT